MLTQDFAYELPSELIAAYPAVERASSRLLVLDRTKGSIVDRNFSYVTNYLRSGDLLILNNSAVMRARLLGRKETGGKIELLIERILPNNRAWVQLKASKAPKPGTWLVLANDVRAQVVEFAADRGMFLVSFHNNYSLLEVLDKYGSVPLPPYMQRDAQEIDLERYQTVYAQELGSVAAPTAGLHFTQELLTQIKQREVNIGYLTLHVGAGTFQPVRCADLSQHKMHSEQIVVSAELCTQIINTKKNGGRIICVGTTTVRALESAALSGGLQEFYGDTNIFITPGFEFKVVDGLITNFHLPESTLLMLVSAFAGKERVMQAYAHAIENKYRFYSYGDAMLIMDGVNEI